jgi:hypothetical protein
MTELVRTCDDHDIAAQPGACVRGGSLCLSFCPAGCCGAVCAAVYTNKTPDACSLLLLYCPLLLILIDSSPSALYVAVAAAAAAAGIAAALFAAAHVSHSIRDSIALFCQPVSLRYYPVPVKSGTGLIDRPAYPSIRTAYLSIYTAIYRLSKSSLRHVLNRVRGSQGTETRAQTALRTASD